VYYESIAMFVFLLLLARRLELRGKISAANRLDRLTRITPRTARRQESDGSYQDVSVEDLVIGDHIRLLPGETLPVDGTLLNGNSSFDESMLTGEAIPVPHVPGDPVIAGTVNGEQPVSVQVTRTVQASTLREIEQLVQRGLDQRPRYALLAEKAAGWFVAALLLIATATALFWLWADPAHWLPHTISVLIVTCPCALALATPVSLAVSAGRFVDLGILPLRMDALDALATSEHFVFDKTGTLTEARPVLADVLAVGGLKRDQCLRYAAALAADSEHPLAGALRRACPAPHLVAAQIENKPGYGIRGCIAGSEWRLGKSAFAGMTENDHNLDMLLSECRTKGQQVSLLSDNDAVQAVLLFESPVRPGTERMLAELRDSGVREISILSGDDPGTVASLAGQLGISDFEGGYSPQEKLAWTRGRQSDGHHITMIGDGVNDAPTLAAADVSISFTDATDIANSSSDFLILGNDAAALADARRLAGRTRHNIMQNLSWAAAYNLLAVPFAAAGLIPPWGAAIGMSLSSLLVVMNALRLQRAGVTFAREGQNEKCSPIPSK
jgi:Cu2+-exporting ATPase